MLRVGWSSLPVGFRDGAAWRWTLARRIAALASLSLPTRAAPSTTQTITRLQTLPVTLYRIQPRLPVRLRDYDTQKARGRSSYDLCLHNGLVLPAVGDAWIGPNGMSLRPNGAKFRSILADFNGEATIYSFLVGMQLPKEFVVLHEHTDHYSLQTSEPVSLRELDERLTRLLQSLPSMTKQQCIEAVNDVDDQDN